MYEFAALTRICPWVRFPTFGFLGGTLGARDARPPAEELPYSAGHPVGNYFTRAQRRLFPFAGFESIGLLAKTNEPGLKAAALRWAHVLLCTHYPQLHWLHTQTSSWTARYLDHQWISLERLAYQQVFGTPKGKCHHERLKVQLRKKPTLVMRGSCIA